MTKTHSFIFSGLFVGVIKKSVLMWSRNAVCLAMTLTASLLVFAGSIGTGIGFTNPVASLRRQSDDVDVIRRDTESQSDDRHRPSAALVGRSTAERGNYDDAGQRAHSQAPPRPLRDAPSAAYVIAPSSSASVARLNVSLIGGASAVMSTRVVTCTPRDRETLTNSNNNRHATSLSPLPECPTQFRLAVNDSTDANIDRRSDWVARKYALYAKRCEQRDGVMWAKLTRAAHDRLATKVAAVILGGDFGAESVFSLFDWGCGCGVGLKFFADFIGGGRLRGLGIDLTDGAVRYASARVAPGLQRRGHLRFCHADGTDLSWIPDATFDAVTAFGSLLHLPRRAICPTVRHLVRITKVGGTIWAGYIDDAETADLLAACDVCSGSGSGSGVAVEVTVVAERFWFKGLGIPKANMQRNPRSIIWRKMRRGGG